MPQKKPALSGSSGRFFGAAPDPIRDLIRKPILQQLQENHEARQKEDAKLRKLGIDPNNSLKPAQAPKGALTSLASRVVEAGSRAMGSTEATAAQRARRFEEINYDWNPLSAADEVGTQLGHASRGSDKFRKDALTEGALNLALEAGGAALAPLARAAFRSKPVKEVVRALRPYSLDLKTPLPGAPTSTATRKFIGPSPDLRQTAMDYAEDVGMGYKPLDRYLKVDPERSKAIAAAFDAMPHDPANPDVRKAYQALAEETLGQYQYLRDRGYEFDFYPTDGTDPYPSPWDAVMDLQNNRRMKVYPTVEGYGDGAISSEEIAANPMLSAIPGETWSGRPVLLNDAFRAVHDAFGHAKDGVGFRADGEETAWASHMPMFSRDAQRALTSETRGQNSWLNYGPHGEANRTASTADTVFADQKIGLLPEWTLDANGMPPSAEWNMENVAKLLQSSPEDEVAHVAHMSPEEFLGLTASRQGREALHTTDYLGDFDPTKYHEAGPITLGVKYGGEPSAVQKSMGVEQLPSLVMDHDGRHRMAALQRQGVTKVPVLIRSRDGSLPRTPEGVKLTPQRGRLSSANNGDTPAILGALTSIRDYLR